jgi:hypothetical protein
MEMKIVLTYDTERRNLRVDGAIVDRLFALGMLEMAKDVVSDFHNKLTPEKVAEMNKAAKK